MKKHFARTYASLSLIILLCLFVVFSSGLPALAEADPGDEGTNETIDVIPVTKVRLDKKSLTLAPKAQVQLTPTISPSDATDQTLRWTSSKPAVASVNSKGLITAKRAGTAVITATTENDKTASCTVYVKKITTFKLNKTKLELSPNKTYQLTYSMKPASVTVPIEWISARKSVATVDQEGKVTTKKDGKAMISAVLKDGTNRTFTCEVTVKTRKVTSISLNKQKATVSPGEGLTLKATIKPINATNKELSWSSSNRDVATVDEKGKVTTYKEGTATITARAADGSGKKGTCKLTVAHPKVASLKLNKSKATVSLTGSLTLKYTLKPSNAFDKSVKWSSSKTSVATVDSDGVVTPVKAGTTNITVRAQDGSGVKATCAVTVKRIGVSKITLNISSTKFIPVNSTFKVKPKITPSNADYPEVEWRSSDETVATIDEEGVITTLTTGSTVITATTDKGRKSVSAIVRVNDDSQATYRALIMGSFSTRALSGYMPIVNNDVNAMRSAISGKSSSNIEYASIRTANPVTSSTEIDQLIQSTFGKAKDNDVSLVYIVSHGKKGYMQLEGGNTITYNQLITSLKAIDGDIVLIIAACNSGSFIAELKSRWASDEICGRLSVLCAAQSGISCCGLFADTEKQSYDFFTGRVVKGLGWDLRNQIPASGSSDYNKDGVITFDEFARYAKTFTPSDIKAYIKKSGTKKPFRGDKGQVPLYFSRNASLKLFS